MAAKNRAKREAQAAITEYNRQAAAYETALRQAEATRAKRSEEENAQRQVVVGGGIGAPIGLAKARPVLGRRSLIGFKR